MTPAFFDAAQNGELAALKKALSADGADINAAGPGGWPAAHLAAYFGHTLALAYLLDHGARLELRSANDNANTPLHAAVAGGKEAAVRLLLERGADIKATYANGTTALHEAAFTGHAGLIQLLAGHGAALAAKNARGETPLALAKAHSRFEVVELLERLAAESEAGS